MAAAPVDSPSGLSKFVSAKSSNSIPAILNNLTSSLVVRTASTSCIFFSANSGRSDSNFFTVHGIIETTYISSGFSPVFSA